MENDPQPPTNPCYRVHRILQQDHDTSCRNCAHVNEDLLHLLSCPFFSEVSSQLINCIRAYNSNITHQQILLLSLEVEPTMELPLVWIISATLMQLWQSRLTKKRCQVIVVRADLEARVNLIRRNSRFKHEAENMTNLIASYF